MIHIIFNHTHIDGSSENYEYSDSDFSIVYTKGVTDWGMSVDYLGVELPEMGLIYSYYGNPPHIKTKEEAQAFFFSLLTSDRFKKILEYSTVIGKEKALNGVRCIMFGMNEEYRAAPLYLEA